MTLATSRAQAADGPLQRGVAADQGPLAAEVPGRVVPVLDVDQPEPCALRQEDLDGADVERRSFAITPPGRLADQRGFGPVLEHDERVAQVDPPLLGQADQAEQRGLERHALGHVEQRAAGPERRVQGREDVVGGSDGLGQQVAFQQLGMVFDRAIQVDEDRAPEPRRIGLARQGAVDVLDAGGVVRAQSVPQRRRTTRGPRRSVAPAAGGPKASSSKPADVGPPPLLVARARPGERLEPGERLATPLDQPGGLVALAQERLEGFLGEAAGRGSQYGSGCTATHCCSISSEAQPGHVNERFASSMSTAAWRLLKQP